MVDVFYDLHSEKAPHYNLLSKKQTKNNKISLDKTCYF